MLQPFSAPESSSGTCERAYTYVYIYIWLVEARRHTQYVISKLKESLTTLSAETRINKPRGTTIIKDISSFIGILGTDGPCDMSHPGVQSIKQIIEIHWSRLDASCWHKTVSNLHGANSLSNFSKHLMPSPRCPRKCLQILVSWWRDQNRTKQSHRRWRFSQQFRNFKKL